jgi:hypothetical protein
VKISIALSEKSISDAIKRLNAYKRGLPKKLEELKRRVAEELAAEVRTGFASAIIDDLLRGGGHPADVTVSIEQSGAVTLVIASGEDAIWAEFGSGVYHNTAAGTSPHPKGSELGFTIGSYGQGKGKRNVWGYYDEDGELRLTHGTPAQMPMYNAVKAVSERIGQIASEVFR